MEEDKQSSNDILCPYVGMGNDIPENTSESGGSEYSGLIEEFKKDESL